MTDFNQVDNIINGLLKVGRKAKTEEDVRLGVESVLKKYLPSLGIQYDAQYEVTISNGRLDALFHHFITEYKEPGKFNSKKGWEKAVNQSLEYITKIAEKNKEQWSTYIAALIDGRNIGFVRFNAENKPVVFPPQPFNKASIELLLKYIRSLNFKALNATNILNDFGPQSEISKQLINSLWNSFNNKTKTRTTMFFTEWRRLFGQVSGFGTNAGPEKAIERLANSLGLNIGNSHAEFIYVLHTFYSLLIKLIAAFILANVRGDNNTIYQRFAGSSLEEQKVLISEIENGIAFRRLGIINFLEGDFFSWYVNEWNEQLAQGLNALILQLVDYEPSTPTLMPESIRDLLKNLYEKLLPKQIRHDLGEFYTPDWLAQYTINSSGFKATDKILDPTCGSGTFLVLAIREKIQQLQDKLTPAELLTHILGSVYGFDLNPLAVVASRTNYILALGDLLEYADNDIEIPVFLTDAILTPIKNGGEYTYKLETNEGSLELHIPETIIAKGCLGSILVEVEELVVATSEGKCSEESAKEQIKIDLAKNGLQQAENGITVLYEKILELEKKNWNRIWCRVIKNHFNSVALSDFDIIVGNPPWLRWSSLPEVYRDNAKPFCTEYGLFSKDVFVGGIETDISTMVLYSTAEKWLKPGGTLSFLITRTVFKNESSEGFRKFKIPREDGANFKVINVEDFTNLMPFEGAKNKPSLVVLRKGETTEYPIPWIVWNRTENAKGPLGDKFNLQEVFESVDRTNLVAYPLYEDGGPWLTVPEQDLSQCLALIQANENNYPARKGICTDCNGIYFGKIIRRQGVSKVVFENDITLGRNDLVQTLQTVVEKELIYPLARGRELSAFRWEFGNNYTILPQRGMDGFTEQEMAMHYPRALSYFRNFENDNIRLLSQRASYRRYHLKRNAPVYSCWNVGPYTFAPYKVAWSEISRKFEACVLSTINDPHWNQPRLVIPDHKLYFVPVETEEEAHYLCAFLNAPQVEEVVMSYVETTQIGTHITEYLYIPQFDNSNEIHRRLSDISLSAQRGVITPQEARDLISRLLPTIL